MDDATQQARPRVDHEAPAPARFTTDPAGRVGPVESALRRPLSVGFALLLVVGNVLGWVWFVDRQDQRFDALESQVGVVQDLPGGAESADPDFCWLLGAHARAVGKAGAFVAATGAEPQSTACQEAAVRGAQGEPR